MTTALDKQKVKDADADRWAASLARDASRDLAPMQPAADAVLLDTTHLSASEVVARMAEAVARRSPRSDS